MSALVMILVLVGLLFWMIYNGLIAKKNKVTEAFAAIDVQLKQRYDLIPNLVAAVKSYMQHEQSTLERLTQLRAQAISGGSSMGVRAATENEISKALGQIMVSVENYPELKADSNFIQLQKSLNEVEAQIAAARRSYNAAVTALNNAIEMFPSNLVASQMGLVRAEVLNIQEVERQNVNVGALLK
jgi:LemA protein